VDLAEHLLARHVRQVQLEHDERGGGGRTEAQALSAVERRVDAVPLALEGSPKHRLHDGVVVDRENSLLHRSTAVLAPFYGLGGRAVRGGPATSGGESCGSVSSAGRTARAGAQSALPVGIGAHDSSPIPRMEDNAAHH
jgi:hypothetical protein